MPPLIPFINSSYICAMVYKVIGLMSGSSLDGLDIAYVQLEEVRGAWSYQLIHSACIPYSIEWELKLKHAATIPVGDFLKLHASYGHYLGEQVKSFMAANNLDHKVHFIASHGHTVFHDPQHKTTFQLGDGASLAAVAELPVINDLRAMDVALGGQGAPIVPIGDKLLFGSYDYLLNIGGIANITVLQNGEAIAFDICAANQVLNGLAEREGKTMDEDGTIAASGALLVGVLEELNNATYYKKAAPKSLSNDDAKQIVFPLLLESDRSVADMLHTATVHIAHQVAAAVARYPHGKDNASLLITGGGALNGFLVSEITKALITYNVTVTVPDEGTVQYKEAIVMALIGTLRWREETNVLSSVTGASRDSVGGAMWLG